MKYTNLSEIHQAENFQKESFGREVCKKFSVSRNFTEIKLQPKVILYELLSLRKQHEWCSDCCLISTPDLLDPCHLDPCDF